MEVYAAVRRFVFIEGNSRREAARVFRAARFPAVKSLDTFDFTAIPGLNKMLGLELARSEYISTA